MRYTRGVEAEGDTWDRLTELKIDKVAVRKGIPTKHLEDEEILEILEPNPGESWAELWKAARVIVARRKIRRNDPC